MICNPCQGTGFLNIGQVGDETLRQFDTTGDHQIILDWIEANTEHDVAVCDCCGNGETWYGIPGEHDWNNPDDPKGCR